MKLYTKGGDKGKTAIIGGKRIYKDSPRVNAYGTVDELNSYVGLIVSLAKEVPELEKVMQDFSAIQQYLFDAGTDIATVLEEPIFRLDEDKVAWLEQKIDEYSEKVPVIEEFIIPGGHEISSHVQIARTIARRAERETVSIVVAGEVVSAEALKFLNRLSDYFFVIARYVNTVCKTPEIHYIRSGKVFRN